jgi:hypothetical protein
LQVFPTEADVGVTAVKAGEAGNVEPNTITVIPAAEDPLTLSVRNKAATTGGTHEEFPQVSQADVDDALAKLDTELADAFHAAVADGSGAPQNARSTRHGGPRRADDERRPGQARRPGARDIRPRAERDRLRDRGRRFAGRGRRPLAVDGERRLRLPAGRRFRRH